MDNKHPKLDELVRKIKVTKKYGDVSVHLIERIGNDELHKRPQFKEAVKATKTMLHQIGGAFLDAMPTNYQSAEVMLNLPLNSFEDYIYQLKFHASTRERVPIIETFFYEMLAPVGRLESVLDVGCGLNPLAVPWMPLKRHCTYIGVDIYHEVILFLKYSLLDVELNTQFHAHDVVQWLPPERVQVAYVLKTLPTLEQSQKGAAADLLRRLNAEWVLVSYPVASLRGRKKGMVENYDAQFRALIDTDWEIVLHKTYSTESAYLIRRA